MYVCVYIYIYIYSLENSLGGSSRDGLGSRSRDPAECLPPTLIISIYT